MLRPMKFLPRVVCQTSQPRNPLSAHPLQHSMQNLCEDGSAEMLRSMKFLPRR